LKILHLYKDYFPVEGGIENHIQQLAQAQAARGHAVTVLVTSRDGHTHVETRNGVRVIYAGRLVTISSAPISAALIEHLRREKPDIAHLQFPYPWGELANYFWGGARRTVITYQSDIVRQKYLRLVYAPLMHRVLAGADRILATSPNYITSSPVLARHTAKCVAVPMGIDPAPFLNVDGQVVREMRARLLANAPPEARLLLFVGVLRYYKGLHHLLRALPMLPETRLAVIGSGRMEREWKMLARELGVAQRVNFLGEIAHIDLPPYYAACDVFVLPSSERSEAFGLVQLEAMASGKPVVATELGTGTSFVTQHEVTGLVVPARDSPALASALQRLTHDEILQQHLGAAGRERVQQHFTLEKMVERIEEVYRASLATESVVDWHRTG
jgi:rhamnosyl/mannosyltransferase